MPKRKNGAKWKSPAPLPLDPQWRERWKLVNERQRRERVSASTSERFRQLAMLMATAREMNWIESLREGEEEVWMRWMRIREHYDKS